MLKTPIETQVEEAAEKAGGILRSRYGLWALGAVSFFESALPVPLLTDPFLAAYILADRRRVMAGMLVTLVTSVIGGVFAYVIAFSFYEYFLEQYVLSHFGEQFFAIAEEFKSGTFVITILGAVTPVPYTIVAMAAGFMKGNLFMFILASFLGRGFRYGIVAWLTYHYGQRALEIARRQLLLATIVCFILAAIYFYIKF